MWHRYVPNTVTVHPHSRGAIRTPRRFTKGRSLALLPAEMPIPKVSLPGLFDTSPSPDVLVDPRWLHTTATIGRCSSRDFRTGTDPHG